jgi:hypothetical protein
LLVTGGGSGGMRVVAIGRHAQVGASECCRWQSPKVNFLISAANPPQISAIDSA